LLRITLWRRIALRRWIALRRAARASQLLGIKLVSHVVIGRTAPAGVVSAHVPHIAFVVLPIRAPLLVWRRLGWRWLGVWRRLRRLRPNRCSDHQDSGECRPTQEMLHEIDPFPKILHCVCGDAELEGCRLPRPASLY
jgi:hypothetical protein